MKKTYSINSTPNLIDRLDALANVNKRSRSKEIEIAIEKHLEPNRGRVFTESDISRLQSEVHAITGDGEVMICFNRLLGVCAG